MTALHRKFWLLAALGVMLDGFDFFIIGVANPLIAEDYDLGAAVKGLVSAAAIGGAIMGAGFLSPLADRIGGHGFAAASVKLGAALGVFLFPILMGEIGTSAVLLITAGACALGFVVTWILRIEPRGRSLDEVSGRIVALAPRPVSP
jgi:MFS family permease